MQSCLLHLIIFVKLLSHLYSFTDKCGTEVYYTHRSEPGTRVQSSAKIKRVLTAGSDVTL